MARSKLTKTPLSLAELWSIFAVSKGEAKTGVELRISILSSYILVFLTIVVIPPNFIIAYRTSNHFGMALLSALAALIFAAPVAYRITRSYAVFRGSLTAAMIVLIAGIVKMGGGPSGVGLFYVFIMTPFFYFILGWFVAALLPLVTVALVALRFLFFGMDPFSIFLIPRVGTAFGVAFGIGTLFVSGAVVTMRALTSGLSVTAYRDPVTGLPNKNKTMEILQQRMESARLEMRPLGLIGLKLGHYDRAAATLDMERADRILKNVAKKLLSVLPPGTFLGKPSESMFLVVAETGELQELRDLASTMLSAVGPSREREEFPLVPAAAITRYPMDGQTPDRLFGNIMTTLQHRSPSGTGPIFFDSTHYDREAERLKIGELLPGAIERGELYLVYHPRLSIAEDRAVGAEVLLRWKNPLLGEITPSKFIPVAEEMEIIRDITAWVLMQEGREEMEILRRFPRRSLIHGVNLSPYDLASPLLFDRIEAGRAELGLDASTIEFEITEGMLVDDNPMVEANLNELGNRRFRLAIDDFGTGYSNLRYLLRFHVNAVKIDQSFIHDIVQDEGKRHIVQAIISLTSSLGMDSVAEGVEAFEQLEWLRAAGCRFAQGHYFSVPLRLPDYISWLRDR